MSKKVLVVDDSVSIREVITFTLENAGYNVFAAEDAKNALKILEKDTVDLIITDLYMPEIDGIELIKRIKQKPEFLKTPVLFLSTESQLNKKMEAKEAGATGWIIKPFVPAKLLAAINKVLE
jgi:two-component system chemotaxis response regulator CheY